MEEYLGTIVEWGNDEVMRGMFTSLQDLREVNPEAFQEKIRFWQRVILGAMQRGLISSSVFRLGQLEARQFLRKGLSPLGLDTVQQEMIKAGCLCAPRSEDWSTWLLAWFKGRTTWLCTPLLEEYASRIMAKLKGPLTDLPSLRQTMVDLRVAEGMVSLSETNQQLLIEHLVAHGQLGLLEGDLIRARQGAIDKMQTTQSQRDLFLLQRTESRLAQQIANLTGQIEGLREEVRLHLRAQDRPLAKHRLQRVKALEALRDTRLLNHATLETILLRVEGAHSDADTLQAMRLGEQTLRQLMAEQGMQVDTVHEVMGRLEEALIDQRQIEQTLAQPLSVLDFEADGLEADEFEAELSHLIQEEKRKEEKAIGDQGLIGDQERIRDQGRIRDQETIGDEGIMQRLERLSLSAPASEPEVEKKIAIVE